MSLYEEMRRKETNKRALLDVVCFFAGVTLLAFALGWQVGLGAGLLAYATKR